MKWVIEFECDGYEAPTINGCFELSENPDILNYKKNRYYGDNVYGKDYILYLVTEDVVSGINEIVGVSYNMGWHNGYANGLSEGALYL